MTTDEDRLTGIVESLADIVATHANQIGVLIKPAEKHDEAIANLEGQWQACLTRIAPPKALRLRQA